MVCTSVFLCFPFRCTHIRSKSTYYQVNSEHKLHKHLRRKLCILYLPGTVYGIQYQFLLFLIHADALQSLPGTAVWADKRFVICPRKGGSLMVAPAAPGAYPDPRHIILHRSSLHFRLLLSSLFRCQHKPISGISHQIQNSGILLRRRKGNGGWEAQRVCPHA